MVLWVFNFSATLFIRFSWPDQCWLQIDLDWIQKSLGLFTCIIKLCPNLKCVGFSFLFWQQMEVICKMNSNPSISHHMLLGSTSVACVIIPVSIPGWIKWHITTAGRWCKELACPGKGQHREGRHGGSHFSNCELKLPAALMGARQARYAVHLNLLKYTVHCCGVTVIYEVM